MKTTNIVNMLATRMLKRAAQIASRRTLRRKYTLDRPGYHSTIEGSTSQVNGPRTGYTLEGSTRQTPDFILEGSTRRYRSEPPFTPDSGGGESWLLIATGGILSFTGLMWLGDLEAAARKKERAGMTQEEIDCIDEAPKRKSKAEWFRPF
jgi:hypothetical protein